MPYVPVMPRRGGFRRGFRRRRRKWQWVRQTGNNTTVVVPPADEFIDLLADWKAQFGFTVNLPEITIWRVRFKISIRVTLPATLTSPENMGVCISMFTNDNTLTAAYPNPASSPYSQQFMLYDTLYISEQAVQGGHIFVGNDVATLYREYDVKARRRINNIQHTLLVGVSPVGSLVQSNGIAWQSSILLAIGR